LASPEYISHLVQGEQLQVSAVTGQCLARLKLSLAELYLKQQAWELRFLRSDLIFILRFDLPRFGTVNFMPLVESALMIQLIV
jgi:hypothetical protein